MKYAGPASEAPELLRTAAERMYGGDLPPGTALEVDTEKRPGWIKIDAPTRDAAAVKIDAPFSAGDTP